MHYWPNLGSCVFAVIPDRMCHRCCVQSVHQSIIRKCANHPVKRGGSFVGFFFLYVYIGRCFLFIVCACAFFFCLLLYIFCIVCSANKMYFILSTQYRIQCPQPMCMLRPQIFGHKPMRVWYYFTWCGLHMAWCLHGVAVTWFAHDV